MTYSKFLFLGCGNMAGAMLDGWLAAGMDPALFTAVDPMRESLPDGVKLLRELPAEGEFDAIMLGVKPQMLKDVVPQIEPFIGPNTVVLSLLAGVQLESLQDNFPRAAGHARVMPNLAVALGKAPVALAASGLDDAAANGLLEFMQPLGTPQWVSEDKFDLVTVLAGSGPAFVYRFIDALGTAATRLGLPENEARDLALAMVEGASLLAAQSEHSPGKLADMVASKGGVTREGMDVLDENESLIELMVHTLRAGRDRSAEMAREARE